VGGPARSREDAEPAFLGEDEVDAPAAPLAPIRPAYPPAARSQGVEGDVTLRVRVRADGGVAGFELLASDRDEFARAAAAAIRAAGFRPGVRDGRAVNSSVTIRVSFRLE
jgi:protein TonB